MSDYSPPTFDSPNFNTSLFLTDGGGYLTLLDADSRYLRLAGGTISGLTTFLAGANVNGTLSINGSPVDLSLISGVTAGTPASNKVLSLDALGNINGPLNCSDINTNTILRVNRTTNGQSFNSTNGTSSCVLYHFNNGDAYLGTSTVNNLVFQTHNTARMTINGSTGAITGINTLTGTNLIASSTLTVNGVDIGSNLAPLVGITLGTPASSKALTLDASGNINGNINVIGSLILNGIAINSSDIAYLSGITAGTVSASKAVVVDSNKDISAFRNVFATKFCNNASYSSFAIDMGNTAADRLLAVFENGTAFYGLGANSSRLQLHAASGAGIRMYTGSSVGATGTQIFDINSAGLITCDSITLDTALTVPLANIRDNAQASGTRTEFLSLGRSSSGSDHGAFSFMNYYQSATQGDSNYITFGPRLRTGLTTGWGMVMTQNGNVSFQDKNANGGAGGFKI